MSDEAHVVRRVLEADVRTDQAALVLVDVWDLHYLTGSAARAEQIVRERIVPLVEACRGAGLTVVHAPAPEVAVKYEKWLAYAADGDLFGSPPSEEDEAWPPKDFRERKGEYVALAKPYGEGALRETLDRNDRERRIRPEVEPRDGDFVVATGAQLHRLCRHRGILHLFYSGFQANMCVLYRDYGLRPMARKGYNCMLIRDCTTGIEAGETLDGLRLTEAAVWDVEMLRGFSVTSEEIVGALGAA
jgi:nicotinamidase-related amidase